MWIFGYGSLIWRPAFEHLEAHPAWIEGWERRFWQGSPDHRGVPESPGRVVTLVESPRSRCWGRAFRVAPGEPARRILAALDHREQGGYRRLELDLHFEAGRREAGLCYIAERDNANFLGPAEVVEIAEQVLASHGPSGSNVEYVLRLAEAHREMGADDPHVWELETRVRELDLRRGGPGQGDGQSGS